MLHECSKKPVVTWCLASVQKFYYVGLAGFLKGCWQVAKQKSQLLFPPLVVDTTGAFLPECYLDVVRVASSWEKSSVSGIIPAGYCLLLWCLLTALLSTLFQSPTPAVSTSAAKADVTSAAPSQISCPHRCPPWSPDSCFSPLTEQSRPCMLTRHFAPIRHSSVGSPDKALGEEKGSYGVLGHSL